MSKHRHPFIVSLFFILTLSSFAIVSAAQDVPLSDKDISILLVKQDGVTNAGFTGQNVEVVAVKSVFKPGDKIEQLLKANGISPNADAYGLIYALNPGIEKLDAITAGLELALPKLRWLGLQPAGTESVLAVLTVDPKRKKELLTAIASISKLSSAVSKLAVVRFGGSEGKKSALGDLDELNMSFELVKNIINFKMRPLNSELLDQLKGDAELAGTALNRFVQSRRPLRADDRESLQMVKQDLLIKRKGFTETKGSEQQSGNSGSVHVVVETLKPEGNNQIEIKSLTVYYIPRHFCDKEGHVRNTSQLRSFDRPSPRADGYIPVADYLIWAGRAGDQSPVSELKRVDLSLRPDQGVITVELTVIR